MRCSHADSMYEFYEKHGMKQARKERETPSFLRYDALAPVMPGSLRLPQSEALPLRPHSVPAPSKQPTLNERPRSKHLVDAGHRTSTPESLPDVQITTTKPSKTTLC